MRAFSSILCVAAAAIAAPVAAAPIRPYSVAALQTAQRAGLPVLVHVHSDWCPTCRAQDPTVAAIARDPAFAKLVILKLDFDSQKPERLALNVAKQSTFVAFHGTAERGRATGIIAPAQIRALAATTLK